MNDEGDVYSGSSMFNAAHGEKSLPSPGKTLDIQAKCTRTLCLRKKCANFETVCLEILRIDFDDIWQKYSKYSRIEFAGFSFRVGLLFLKSTFRVSNPTLIITQILKITPHTACQHGAIQQRRQNFDQKSVPM